MKRARKPVTHLLILLMLVSMFALSSAPSVAHAGILLNAPSASWVPILVGPKFDPGQDTQATSAVDLEGNAGNPLMYLWYDDKGDTDPDNDELALRYRVDNARDSQKRFSGYLWIGLDVDLDGDLDVFLMLEGKNGAYTLNVYSAGSGLNNSPSTSSIETPVPLADLVDGSTFRIDNVAAIDGATHDDVDGDRDHDDFVSFKFNFSQFAELANAKPLTGTNTTIGSIGLTKDSPLRFVVASAQQTNALNGDMGGYGPGDNQATTFTAQGAFAPILAMGDPAGTETASGITLSGPESVVAGAVSDIFTLTAVNRTGAATPVAQDTTFALESSAGGTASFTPGDSVTMPAGQSSVTFAYSDTAASQTPKLITAAWAAGGAPLGSAAHPITVGADVPASVAFATPPRTVAAGSTSDLITVQLRDSYGNVAASSGETTLDLSAEGVTFRTPAGDADITQVTVGDGQSGADFRARAALPGAYTITAVGPELAEAQQTLTVSPAAPPTLSGPAGPVYVKGSGTFTAGGGSGGYTYSLLTDNSGGASIDEGGLYTAGLTGGVTDTVQVTDSNGQPATATVNVVKRPTRTVVTCTPASVLAGGAVTCTAVVTDTSGERTAVPVSGVVTFGSDRTGTFSGEGTCTLSGGSCSVSYTPSGGAGTHVITAAYAGSASHSSSAGTGMDRQSLQVTTATGTLGGTVETDYGAPVAGISLYLLNGAGESVAAGATGTGGAYQFSGLDPGDYTVMVASSTTPLAQAATTVTDSGSATLDLIIPATAKLLLTADPAKIVGDGNATSQLQAELQRLDGTTVSGATVTFAATAGSLSSSDVVTGPAGTAVTTLRAPVIEGVEKVTREASVTVTDVERGLFARTAIEIAFLPPTVEGVVMDNGSPRRPLVGRKVTVRRVFEDGSVFEATAYTDETGHYAVTVPKGNVTYDVTVEVPVVVNGVTTTITSSQSVSVGALSGEGDVVPAPKTVNGLLSAPDGTAAGWTQLNAGLGLVGTLKSESGEALPNPVVLQPDGTFQIDQVPIGTYEVVFQTEVEGKRLVGAKMQIKVENDGELSIATALIDPFGIVTDSVTHLPMAGVHMELHDAATGNLVSLPILPNFAPNQNRVPQDTNAEGKYAWMVFPNQAYYIVATRNGYKPYNSKDHPEKDGVIGDSRIENGIIYVGETLVNYDFAMEKLAAVPAPAPAPAPAPQPVATTTVHGVVTEGALGRPVAGAKVAIAELSAVTYTAADGTYQIAVPQRDRAYTMQIATPAGIAMQTASVPKSDAADMVVAAQPEIAGQLLYSAVTGGAPQALTAQQAQSIRATLERTDGTAVSTPVTVSSTGTFAVADLPAGTYRILFRSQAADGRLLAVADATVPLTQEGQLAVQSVAINPFATVRDAKTGAPLGDVLVSLFWADSAPNRAAGHTLGTLVSLPPANAFLPAGNTNPQRSDAQGRHGWLCLPQGDYYVVAKKDGYLPYDSRTDGTFTGCRAEIKLAPMQLEVLPEYHRYILGYPDGTFKPEKQITRAEVAAIFARLLQANLNTVQPATFRDLPATHWAARHIAVVIAKGLMKGDPGGSFRPDSPITRAELATVIARYKALPLSNRTVFQDIAGHWAEPAITATFEAGIVLGFTDNTFGPARTTTRAELVAMVNRMLGWGQLMTGRPQPRWSDVPFTHWAVRHIEKASVSHTAKPGAGQVDYLVEEIQDTIQ